MCAVQPAYRAPLRDIIKQFQQVQQEQRLLFLSFQTVCEYLYLLRDVSRELGEAMGPRAMWYLAAAVSDYHIPLQRMVIITIHDELL